VQSYQCCEHSGSHQGLPKLGISSMAEQFFVISTCLHSLLLRREFLMNKAGNVPGIESVHISTLIFGNGGLYVNIRPIPSNFLFYGLADLDSEPFHRRGQSDNPMLHVKLNNAEDLIFKKVSDLLSTSIKKVEINGYLLSPENLSLVAQLLRGS
ncbi:hypothetical protein PMAYCL1PPCAC_26452, partial [Pristionchus mayeri]